VRQSEIVRLLSDLGVSSVNVRDGWVSSCCPLAKYTHVSGSDKHPSFGISINDDGTSVWKCFTCSNDSRNLINLVETYAHLSGRKPLIAGRLALNEADQAPPWDVSEPILSAYKDVWSSSVKKPEVALPYEILSLFPLLNDVKDEDYATDIIDYLTDERMISLDQIFRYKVRASKADDLIVFPFTVPHREISVLRVRKSRTKSLFTINPEYVGQPWLRFPNLSESGAIFGADIIDWSKPVFIVEGELDALRLASLGNDNVVAIGTNTPTDMQIKNLCGFHFFVGLDSDKAGKEGAQKTIGKIRKFIPGSIVVNLDWGVVNCKDPGDLLNCEQVERVVSAGRVI